MVRGLRGIGDGQRGVEMRWKGRYKKVEVSRPDRQNEPALHTSTFLSTQSTALTTIFGDEFGMDPSSFQQFVTFLVTLLLFLTVASALPIAAPAVGAVLNSSFLPSNPHGLHTLLMNLFVLP